MRLFSVGITGSALGLDQITGGSNTTTTQLNAANVQTVDLNTKNHSSRFGYGITMQVAVTEHFTVAIGAYLRRMGYTLTSNVTTDTTTFINGTSSTTSATTGTVEDTRATLVDIPLLVRFYGKGRHTPGARWFVEGGGAWRDVRKISSSISATDSTGVVACCTTGTIRPAHSNARGVVGGAGAQFIDPFGIRVIPEIRYTRWFNQIFDTTTTHMQRNQVEAALTLSF